MNCPYCAEEAVLTDSAEVYSRSYGPIYLCRPCQAWVGVHKGTTRPLGTLANAELREWRKRAHAAFDPLWKGRRMKRAVAYQRLAEIVGVPKQQAHIGMFTVEQCQKLINALAAKPVKPKGSEQ
jgi:hypothetical protein